MTGGDTVSAVEAAVRVFVEAEPGRRVFIRSLRGPRIAVAYRAEEVVPAACLLKLPLAVAVADAGP